MKEMIIIAAAGIFGTGIMTMFMNLMSQITGYDFRVPSILGSMATMQKRPSGQASRSMVTLIAGNLLHYAIGIVFAFVYATYLWICEAKATFENAVLYGLIAGGAAVVFWFTFIKLHPSPPVIKMPHYLAFIFIGHLFFAMGVWLVFHTTTLL